jgi:hypothetical protein
MSRPARIPKRDPGIGQFETKVESVRWFDLQTNKAPTNGARMVLDDQTANASGFAGRNGCPERSRRNRTP